MAFLARPQKHVALIAIVLATAVVAGVYVMLTHAPSALLSCVTSGEHGETMSQSCARDTVARILKTHSPRDVLKYVTASSTPFTVVKNCHGIAHAVGEDVYRRSGTVEVALSKCTEQCFGGCMHGVVETAVEETFGDADEALDVAHAGERLFAEGAKYCADAQLCHGIGHLLYKREQSYGAALSACESVANGIESQRCFEGVFMESLGGEGSFGFPSAAARRSAVDNPAYPCDAQPHKYRYACFMYIGAFQDGYFFERGITDPRDKQALQFNTCSNFEGHDRSLCLLGSATAATQRLYDGAIGRSYTYCDPLSGDDKTACLLGLVMNWVGSDLHREILNICEYEKDAERSRSCYVVAFELMRRIGADAPARACARTNNPEHCSLLYESYTDAEAFGIEKRLFGTVL